MTVEEILFATFRCELCGETLSVEEKNAVTPEILSALYKLSKAHDLAHLVCDALDKNGVLQEGGAAYERFNQQRQLAVCRYEQIDYEYKRVLQALEEAKIAHMPLKGAITRELYPEPWMRTSCDIDILIAPQDIKAAAKLLCEELGYKQSGRTAHDVSLYSGGGVHLELHHDLIEGEDEMQGVLKRVWELSAPAADKTYCYEMPDELFYFYHIAHMAKHFAEGGCGVRPFLDLWLLDNRAQRDEEKRAELLAEGGLTRFAGVARAISQAWLSGGEKDALAQKTEAFVLGGGVYGSLENRVAVQQVKKGGKLRYAFSRVFLTYEELRLQYPVLDEKKWLTPVCEVRRWFRLAFCGRAKRSMKEFSVNASVTDETRRETDELLRALGL